MKEQELSIVVEGEKKKEDCKKGCCDDKNAPKYSKAHLLKWGKIAMALATFTIIYNVGEGVTAIYYGMEEESISLLGFGCDSFVEVFSAIIVVLQMTYKEKIMSGDGFKKKKK